MKKKIIICLIAVVLVLAISIGLWAQWFFSPGVHTFWKLANFDVSDRKCYIVDRETEEIIGQSTITIRGFANEIFDKNTIEPNRYEVNIEGYTDVIQDWQEVHAWASVRDGEWKVAYFEEQVVYSGIDVERLDENLVTAIVYFGTVEPDDIIARITTRLDGESRGTVYAVCAESEAAALELFRAYKNS